MFDDARRNKLFFNYPVGDCGRLWDLPLSLSRLWFNVHPGLGLSSAHSASRNLPAYPTSLA
jgi:hypothetical protein